MASRRERRYVEEGLMNTYECHECFSKGEPFGKNIYVFSDFDHAKSAFRVHKCSFSSLISLCEPFWRFGCIFL